MTACPERAYIDRHFEGTIPPANEHAMREHLPTCNACDDYYRRWLLLAKLDPQALPAEGRIARGLGFRRRSWPRIVPFAAGALMAAAAAFALRIQGGAEPSGFTARGAIHGIPESRVLVYDVRPGEPPVLASGSSGASESGESGESSESRKSLGRHDELAFAYENGSANDRLVIFGIDEHRHVYWFYPAWTHGTENPVAIPIETDGRRHELPDAVRHDLDGAQLEIHAVFLNAPLAVRTVEGMLHAHPDGPLPVPGAIESRTTFAISP